MAEESSLVRPPQPYDQTFLPRFSMSDIQQSWQARQRTCVVSMKRFAQSLRHASSRELKLLPACTPDCFSFPMWAWNKSMG